MGHGKNVANLKCTIFLYHYLRVNPVLHQQPQTGTDLHQTISKREVRKQSAAQFNQHSTSFTDPDTEGPRKGVTWGGGGRDFSHFHTTKCNCLSVTSHFPSHQSTFNAITLPFQYYSPIYALKNVCTDRKVILEWILQKQGQRAWIGFASLRTGTIGKFL